ncbi:calcium/sodium antiporter [Candidatus Mycalebacterium sp.]
MFFTDSLIFEVVLLIAGIAGVWVGANAAVEGASLFSRKLGISPVVSGLTVIAIGTSLPELLICLIAAFKGSADIATGNIIGSNISNIGLIMGIIAALSPIRIHQGLRAETISAFVFLVILIFLFRDGTFGRGEGGAVFALLVPLVVYLYVRRAGKTGGAPVPEKSQSRETGFILFITAAGLAALAIGSDLVVKGASGIGFRAGVPEVTIGASAVAVGTSLPELAASLAAIARREHSIAVGNLVGSNLFNIVILGLTASILPLPISPDITGFQLPFAIAISALAVPFMKKDTSIGRGAGVSLLLLYGFFLYRIF